MFYNNAFVEILRTVDYVDFGQRFQNVFKEIIFVRKLKFNNFKKKIQL
jgi:hypothetical protein